MDRGRQQIDRLGDGYRRQHDEQQQRARRLARRRVRRRLHLTAVWGDQGRHVGRQSVCAAWAARAPLPAGPLDETLDETLDENVPAPACSLPLQQCSTSRSEQSARLLQSEVIRPVMLDDSLYVLHGQEHAPACSGGGTGCATPASSASGLERQRKERHLSLCGRMAAAVQGEASGFGPGVAAQGEAFKALAEMRRQCKASVFEQTRKERHQSVAEWQGQRKERRCLPPWPDALHGADQLLGRSPCSKCGLQLQRDGPKHLGGVVTEHVFASSPRDGEGLRDGAGLYEGVEEEVTTCNTC